MSPGQPGQLVVIYLAVNSTAITFIIDCNRITQLDRKTNLLIHTLPREIQCKLAQNGYLVVTAVI